MALDILAYNKESLDTFPECPDAASHHSGRRLVVQPMSGTDLANEGILFLNSSHLRQNEILRPPRIF